MYASSEGIQCLVRGLARAKCSGRGGHQETAGQGQPRHRLILGPVAGQFSSYGLSFPVGPENGLHL